MKPVLRSHQHSAIPHLAHQISARSSCRGSSAFSRVNTSIATQYQLSQRKDYATIPSSRIPSRIKRTVNPPKQHVHAKLEHAESEQSQPQPRKITGMIWASSLFGFTLATYLSYLYVSYSQAVQKSSRIHLPQNSDVSDRWRDLGRDYDDEVNLSERMMLLRSKRKALVNEAYGNVLEVSVGTGRNMDLYDLRPYDPDENASTGRSRKRLIRSLTFNDQSEYMVGQAEKKFEDMESKRSRIEQFAGPVDFVVGDAGIKGVIKRPEGGYDTIVQTMSICSMVDPVGFLKRLGELCRQPAEKSKWTIEEDDADGGKILLLEHGRGHYDWINRFLDNGAKTHAIHYGCWWNKDIGEVIEESGLIVERLRRHHLGTTWEIVLRPARKVTV